MAQLKEAYPDPEAQGGGDIWDSNKHTKAFVGAIQQDNLDGHEVSKWVHLTGYYAHGRNPNDFGVNEATPLHIAAYCGSSAAALTLLAAGAKSVLAAAWDTADEPTRILSKAFYTCLAAEPAMPQAEALRQAAKALRAADNGKWDHPAFWAAFSIVGAAKGI